MNEPILSVRDFRKTYGKTVAVSGITFTVQRGEIFGLLGPKRRGQDQHIGMPGGHPQSGWRARSASSAWTPAREPHKLRNLIGVQLQSSGVAGRR